MSRYRTSPRQVFIVVSCIVVLIAGALAHRSEVVEQALWVLGFWLALSAAVGAITAAAGYRANTRRTRAVNRELRKARRRFNAKLDRLLDEQQAGQ